MKKQLAREKNQQMEELKDVDFKNNEFEEVLVGHSKALKLVNNNRRKVTFIKDKAAVYLKKKYYDLVIKDCREAIDMIPKDFEPFYQRCNKIS